MQHVVVVVVNFWSLGTRIFISKRPVLAPSSNRTSERQYCLTIEGGQRTALEGSHPMDPLEDRGKKKVDDPCVFVVRSNMNGFRLQQNHFQKTWRALWAPRSGRPNCQNRTHQSCLWSRSSNTCKLSHMGGRDSMVRMLRAERVTWNLLDME